MCSSGYGVKINHACPHPHTRLGGFGSYILLVYNIELRKLNIRQRS